MRRFVLLLGALLLLMAGVLLVLAPSAHAQSVPSIGFDVVSIKQSRSAQGGMTILSPLDSDRILVKNATARAIIGEAYGIRLHDLIVGVPAWADSDAYDMDAKVAAADVGAFKKLLPMQRNPMLRSVLADRFHLKCHFETRALPAYALVIAKSGPKLTAVQPAILPDGQEDPGGIDTGGGRIKGTGASMLPLVQLLQLLLGRPVLDRTGLTGRYNFTLRCAPTYPAMRPVINGEVRPLSAEEGALPDLFTAIQEQLGLRLKGVRGPVTVLVVDHIEKPTED
jgi:uncharacterized protein (TIGR03435 family)